MSLHKAYWSVVYFPLENFIWLWYKDKAEASLKKGVKFKNKIKLKKKKGVRRCLLLFSFFEHFENDCC